MSEVFTVSCLGSFGSRKHDWGSLGNLDDELNLATSFMASNLLITQRIDDEEKCAASTILAGKFYRPKSGTRALRECSKFFQECGCANTCVVRKRN